MDEKEIEKVIHEEQWTRMQIGSFTLAQFQQLDELVSQLDDEGQQSMKTYCDGFLKDSPKSIVAMYVAGSIMLLRHGQEDNLNLLNLIEMFADIKKLNIVEFLCKKILAVSENRHALRLLANCYEQNGDEDDKFAIYERLVLVDHDEIDITRQIAERALNAKEKAKAVKYYKIAFDRTISHHDVTQIRPLFDALLGLCTDQFTFNLGNADKVGEQSLATGVAVLRDMESLYKNDVDKRITCEKKILFLDKEDIPARTNLVASYRAKYKNHSRLESCLKESSLTNNYIRDIMNSIEDFEKNISFDKGTFVYQESKKRIGRIRSIDEQWVTIDFPKQEDKDGTKMTYGMAFKSLKALPKTHILVLKGCVDKDRLAKKFIDDVEWGVNIMLSSFDGKCSLKQMKKELVTDVLSESQWSVWYKAAREILMNGDHYDVSPDDDSFILRETPVSYDEKQLAIFNSHDKFYDKVRDLKKYLAGKSDTNSESFYQMIKYFSNILDNRKDQLSVDSEMMGSYLLLDDLLNRKKMTFIKIPQEVNFENLVGRIPPEQIPQFFRDIDDPDLKKCFIDWTVETQQNWSELLLKLFPHYLTSYIPDIYRSKKKADEFMKIYPIAIYEYRDYSSMLIYLIKSTSEKDWMDAGITPDRLLFTEIEMLSLLNKRIDAKVDAQDNGANARILMELLFGKDKKDDGGKIIQYLNNGDEEAARKIDSVVQSCFNLDPGEKIHVRYLIQEKYPSMVFNDQQPKIDKDTIIPTGWFCTPASLEAKKQELDHIQHVDLPDVAKEIGEAREKGDLRENSEYKYGKEKQQFLNTKAVSLKEEIDKAIVVQKEKIDPSKTSFGTKVDLLDNKSGKKISYVIMGPWESDPNNNVINILAPLGTALINKTKGEHFTFSLGDQPYDYTVEDISVADCF